MLTSAKIIGFALTSLLPPILVGFLVWLERTSSSVALGALDISLHFCGLFLFSIMLNQWVRGSCSLISCLVFPPSFIPDLPSLFRYGILCTFFLARDIALVLALSKAWVAAPAFYYVIPIVLLLHYSVHVASFPKRLDVDSVAGTPSRRRSSGEAGLLLHLIVPLFYFGFVEGFFATQ